MSFFEMISGGKESLLNYKTFYADTFLVYFLLLPFFLLGAARYRRYQFAATLLILSVVFVVYNYLQLFLLFNFSHGLAFGHTFFIRYGDFDYYLFPGGKFVVQKTDLIFRLKIMNTLAWLVIAAGLYITAFHSLKERQL
jgi:hypothetical protein